MEVSGFGKPVFAGGTIRVFKNEEKSFHYLERTASGLAVFFQTLESQA
jgi:hypothetical protein